MPAIVIRPTVLEYGLNREAYNDLLVDLRSRDIDARIEQPAERRSGGVEHAAAEVAVYLFENADNLAVTVGAVVWALKRIKGKPRAEGRASRKALIYGPNGDVLREVNLDEPD